MQFFKVCARVFTKKKSDRRPCRPKTVRPGVEGLEQRDLLRSQKRAERQQRMIERQNTQPVMRAPQPSGDAQARQMIKEQRREQRRQEMTDQQRGKKQRN